ncbi:MAG: bifunctional transcriptional activator/DNA repair protein Ada [Acidobacteriaceae bacterium]|nr:bifunctional transcriptional activator/DNA repair protein Ada [Acidobacteriaceae bacterium]
MQRAFFLKDSSYNGLFFTAVRTTGVFCMPSCPSRRPNAENIEFFPSAREALAAGYRPCKRCSPMQANGAPPDWTRPLFQLAEDASVRRIREEDIRRLGIDPVRARRYFMQNYGMTFQSYCRAQRMAGALESIRNGVMLDDVIGESGYESHSGFRDAFRRVFGDPPVRTRSNDCVLATWTETPLGPMVAGANRDGVCLLEFTDRRKLETQFLTTRKRFRCTVVPGTNEHLEQLKDELPRYFAAQLTRFTVPLVYPGTPFEERVWNELLKIPYGDTRSYEEIAAAVGAAGASRAVGAANGRNRISIVIPCHRVINKSGLLSGYGGGVWRKRILLESEKARTPIERGAVA